MDKIESGFVGAILGVIALGGVVFSSGPITDTVKVFQRESKPSVMRLYRDGSDGIYVANSENNENYIKLNEYLEKIPNEADRNIEKATIEKIVGWYE